MSKEFINSIANAVDRLQEAEFFLFQFAKSDGGERNAYYLNAFLSASRSTTFVLQKELSKNSEFKAWYPEVQKRISNDMEMKFFLEARNFTQKQSNLALIGAGNKDGSWTYSFVGRNPKIPKTLHGQNVIYACGRQIQKLSSILVEFYDLFPHSACAWNALSPAGQKELNYSISDACEKLGWPRDWLEGAEPSWALSELQKSVHQVPIDELRRLSAGTISDGSSSLKIDDYKSDPMVARWADDLRRDNSSPDPFESFRVALIRSMMEAKKES